MAVVHRYERPKYNHSLIGLWHIYEMEEWDEDYFNMETQAYIEVTPQNGGEFQFGLVTGSIDGYLEDNNGKSVSLLLGMALTKWMKLADGFSSAAKMKWTI